MIVEINKDFAKEFEKLKDKILARNILYAIQNVENAKSVSDIKQIKKLAGATNAFRIKKGDYRIGVYIIKDVVEFAAFAHRKDIYKTFP